jgi:magnesium chelatase family protein
LKECRVSSANADMTAGEIQALCQLSTAARDLLNLSVKRMKLSARSYHRVLKLSRTIADLSAADLIDVPHVAEAIQYRPK